MVGSNEIGAGCIVIKIESSAKQLLESTPTILYQLDATPIKFCSLEESFGNSTHSNCVAPFAFRVILSPTHPTVWSEVSWTFGKGCTTTLTCVVSTQLFKSVPITTKFVELLGVTVNSPFEPITPILGCHVYAFAPVGIKVIDSPKQISSSSQNTFGKLFNVMFTFNVESQPPKD